MLLAEAGGKEGGCSWPRRGRAGRCSWPRQGGAPGRAGGALGQDARRPGPPPVLRAAPCSWAPGRAWEIRAEVLDRFVCLVRAKGLSKNNVVFPDLTGSRSGRAGPGRPWAAWRWASKLPWEPVSRHGPRAGPRVGARRPRGPAWAQTAGLLAPWSLPPPGSPSWAISSAISSRRRASHCAPAFPASAPLCVHATCTPVHTRVHREKCTLMHHTVFCPQARVHPHSPAHTLLLATGVC